MVTRDNYIIQLFIWKHKTFRRLEIFCSRPCRVWRSSEGRNPSEEPLLSLPVRRQQLPWSHRVRVAADRRAGLRHRAELRYLRGGGGGRLRLRLHWAVQRVRPQLTSTWPLLWFRGKVFLLPLICKKMNCVWKVCTVSQILHVYLPFLSPGRASTRLGASCSSAFTVTTQSAKKASTSATRAPSSRRAFTPGNDLPRSRWPLPAVPANRYPDLHHGKKKKKKIKNQTRIEEEPDPSPLLMQASRRSKAVVRCTFDPPLWLNRISKLERWRSFSPHQAAHCLLRRCRNVEDSYSERGPWTPHTLRSFQPKEHAPSQGPADHTGGLCLWSWRTLSQHGTAALAFTSYCGTRVFRKRGRTRRRPAYKRPSRWKRFIQKVHRC